MTKKEKILFSFIANIIDDEKPKTLHILTRYDMSKLLKRIEKLDIKSSEENIGIVKNLLSQKIVVFTNFNNDKETDEMMLKLGLQTELRDKNNKIKCFSYNLKTYNNKRSWNNSKGWANPENFDKFRW